MAADRPVRFHPHAALRLLERGTTEAEVVAAVLHGEAFAAKHGRSGFRRNFPYDSTWRGRRYSSKQVEAYAVIENDEWLVITVLVKFF